MNVTTIKFVNNLVNERKHKGMTQMDVAKKTGLRQQVISSIELTHKASLQNAIKYLVALDIDINKLFK